MEMNTLEKFKMFVVAVVMLPLFFVVPQSIAQQEPATPQPYIIFIGTVDTLNAAGLRSLKASNNTSVVVVEKIFQKPDAIALAPRDRITVLTDTSSNPLQKGVRALFVTQGWIYGESLAVKVVSWEPASTATSTAAGEQARATAKMQELVEKDLRASINSVDIIVVGRVRKIQGPSAPELTPASRRRSEHDPDWQEAIIQVEETLKGPANLKEVVVRFPLSLDIMWVGYPRFKVGQEGTFLLRQDRISGAPNAVVDGKSVTAYMATTRKDVLNKADSRTIKKLLNTNP
jgi:hypothetical protein